MPDVTPEEMRKLANELREKIPYPLAAIAAEIIDQAADQLAPRTGTPLHDAIMNLPVSETNIREQNIPPICRFAYLVGHRDARHAAAELSLPPAADGAKEENSDKAI